jgi:hypothetical protein
MGYDHMHHLARFSPPQPQRAPPDPTIRRYADFVNTNNWLNQKTLGAPKFVVQTAPVWGPAVYNWARSPQGQEVIAGVANAARAV